MYHHSCSTRLKELVTLALHGRSICRSQLIFIFHSPAFRSSVLISERNTKSNSSLSWRRAELKDMFAPWRWKIIALPAQLPKIVYREETTWKMRAGAKGNPFGSRERSVGDPSALGDRDDLRRRRVEDWKQFVRDLKVREETTFNLCKQRSSSSELFIFNRKTIWFHSSEERKENFPRKRKVWCEKWTRRGIFTRSSSSLLRRVEILNQHDMRKRLLKYLFSISNVCL